MEGSVSDSEQIMTDPDPEAQKYEDPTEPDPDTQQWME
jgi:hypothetical protein